MSLIIINDLDKPKLSEDDIMNLKKCIKTYRYIDRDIYFFTKKKSEYARIIFLNILNQCKNKKDIKTFLIEGIEDKVNEEYERIINTWERAKHKK